MCFFLYIAASHPLATTSRADEPHSGFYVISVAEDSARVGHLLAKSHVVYAGAQGACGCYFLHGSDSDRDDLLQSLAAGGAPESFRESAIANHNLRKDEVNQLRTYLREAARMGPVEVLATWNEIKPPKNVVEVDADRFGGTDGFKVEEDWLYRISG